MAELTFRDFAGAVMQNDHARGAAILQELLGLGPDQATAATAHFAAEMKDPAFMMKAMGLRTAVTAGNDAEIASRLAECFGLAGAVREHAVATLRARYPAS